MANEVSMDDVISNTQGEMEDFTSFEEADNSIGQSSDKGSEDDEEASFEEKSDKKESKSDKDESGDDEEDDEKPIETKKEVSKKEDEEAKESKKITLQDGKNKVEIKPDSKVTIQVDGKPVEMTIQEAINKASGNVAVEKRFSELAVEKNKFKSEKGQYDSEKTELISKVSNFTKAVQNEDGLGAISALSELTGHNPVELRAHFKELVINDVKKYLAMSPEQQKEFDIQQERDYYKQDKEMREQQVKARDSVSDLEKNILQFQAKYGLDNAALVALYDEAEEKSVDIQSAKDLESYHSMKLTQQKSSSLISQVDPSLSDNTEALRIVSDFMTKNPELDDDAVKEAIKNAIGTEEPAPKQKKSISDKIQNKQVKNSKGKIKESVAFEDDDEDELLTFADLGY